jgi:hypothetical protein
MNQASLHCVMLTDLCCEQGVDRTQQLCDSECPDPRCFPKESDDDDDHGILIHIVISDENVCISVLDDLSA